MIKEGLKSFLDISQVVEIIKKWVFSSNMEIKNILKMARRNDIIVIVITNITIKEYGRNKRYQTSKYTILKNGVYYVHYDWENN